MANKAYTAQEMRKASQDTTVLSTANNSRVETWIMEAMDMLRQAAEMCDKLDKIAEICNSVKPCYGSTIMPTPWTWRASKWGIRDIDILDADEHRVVQVTECYPPERMGSAIIIPLSVNAMQSIRSIIHEYTRKEQEDGE